MKPLHSVIIGFVAGLILLVCMAAAPPKPVSISGSLVWTNDGSYTWQAGLPTPDPSGTLPGPPFFFRNDGSLFVGTNVTQDATISDFTHFSPFYQISFTDSNEPPYVVLQSGPVSDESYRYYAQFSGINHNDDTSPTISWSWTTKNTNGIQTALNWFISPAGSYFNMTTNATIVFQSDQNGVIKGNGFRKVNGNAPAEVGGITYNLTVVTNGVNTATLHFTNGVLMTVTAP